MSSRNIIQLIEEHFSKTEKSDWLKVAQKELGEKKNIQSLSWTIDSLELSPYYDKSDLSNLRYLEDYQKLFTEAKPGWQNIPEVFVENESFANKEALQLLQGGADGILFNTLTLESVNIDLLLKGIHAEMCSLSFIAADTNLATKFLVYAKENNYDSSKLNGAFFQNRNLPIEIFKLPASLKYGIVVPQSSPVDEIVFALTQALSYMDTLQDEHEAGSYFRSLTLLIYTEDNFLLTISKLKSIRMLWTQLAVAYGIDDYLPTDLQLHVQAGSKTDEKLDPHTGMISNTVDALAAVIGGCNALTLRTIDSNDLSKRIALNVSHLLKEESHIDKVFDPLAGSYAIEKITNKLSTAAWQRFQQTFES